MSVELPKDAKGREIPLDTVVLFRRDGHAFNIVRWSFITDFVTGNALANSWCAVSENGANLAPKLMYLTPPDSWKKLEDDLDRCIEEGNLCLYHSPSGQCSACTISGDGPCHGTSLALKDIKERIRKLRGEDDAD